MFYLDINTALEEHDKDVEKMAKGVLVKWAERNKNQQEALNESMHRIKVMYNRTDVKKRCERLDENSYCRVYEDSITEDCGRDILAMVVVEMTREIKRVQGAIRAYFLGFIMDHKIPYGNKVMVGESLQPGGEACKRAYYAVEASSFNTDLVTMTRWTGMRADGEGPGGSRCPIISPIGGRNTVSENGARVGCRVEEGRRVPEDDIEGVMFQADEDCGYEGVNSDPRGDTRTASEKNPCNPSRTPPTASRAQRTPAQAGKPCILKYAYVFKEEDELDDSLDIDLLRRTIADRKELMELVEHGSSAKGMVDWVLKATRNCSSASDFLYLSKHAVHFLARTYSTDEVFSARFADLEAEILKLWIDASEEANGMYFRRASPEDRVEFLDRISVKNVSRAAQGDGLVLLKSKCAAEVTQRLALAMKMVYCHHISDVATALDKRIRDTMNSLYQ